MRFHRVHSLLSLVSMVVCIFNPNYELMIDVRERTHQFEIPISTSSLFDTNTQMRTYTIFIRTIPKDFHFEMPHIQKNGTFLKSLGNHCINLHKCKTFNSRYFMRRLHRAFRNHSILRLALESMSFPYMRQMLCHESKKTKRKNNNDNQDRNPNIT